VIPDLVRQFAAGGGWVPLVLAFGVLPYVYVAFAIEVHKEYADFTKTLFASSESLEKGQVSRLLERGDAELYIFEMDWWIICAIAVLMVAIFSSAEMVEFSNLLSPICIAGQDLSRGRVLSECEKVRSVITLYGVVVTLLIGFRLAWARVVAARQLRHLYAEALFDMRKRSSTKPMRFANRRGSSRIRNHR
jgi:hypothetical protein